VNDEIEPVMGSQTAARLSAYERAWCAGDAEQAVALFTADRVRGRFEPPAGWGR
jgi:hypothetical protein